MLKVTLWLLLLELLGEWDRLPVLVVIWGLPVLCPEELGFVCLVEYFRVVSYRLPGMPTCPCLLHCPVCGVVLPAPYSLLPLPECWSLAVVLPAPVVLG